MSVRVTAEKTGWLPVTVTRTLDVDLFEPSYVSWPSPSSLQVGVAIDAMTPDTFHKVIVYSATGLPSGLAIDGRTGVIGGTPDTLDENIATATVTDIAGNPAEVSVAFPAVDKGDQVLSGFAYSADTVTFGDPAPTLRAPTGARGTLSYTATPSEVCSVGTATGELTLAGAGDCEVTVTAASTDDYNEATAAFTLTVEGVLLLTIDAIAGDDVVNVAEKASGFAITGATGTESGVSVEAHFVYRTDRTRYHTIHTTSGSRGGWSVSVPAGASWIAGAGVSVRVTAEKTGFVSAVVVTRTFAVDLAAPSVSYTAPASLQVGVALVAMTPSSSDIDIASYSATGLPSGLVIDGTTGAIDGTPDAADATTASATVRVTDTAGNPADVSIAFPAVDKGDQVLSGFAYSADTVTYGDPAPTLRAPTGARGTLSYTATPSTVCTVDSGTGALTLVGLGSCEVTAKAASTANYNEATASYTVTVEAAGTLALTVGAIAGDGAVNIAEKTAGFAITGATGTETGVSVSVTIGAQSPLSVTSDNDGAWSVSVAANAAYITGTSVAVSVSAEKTGFTSPVAVTRSVAVDLAAPSVSYTAPSSLQVGVALVAMTPSTSDTDIASYSATDLPSGLVIDGTTGAIDGTPDTADATTASATARVTDTAGNPADVSIVFPEVDKGAQVLSGFAYSADTVTYGDPAPALTAPTGARGTLSYTATPSEVCTVDTGTGALTLAGLGSCEITAKAVSTDNYNEATASYTVTVEAAGTLALTVDTIAGDGTVNIAEKTAGFAITGATGTESGVSGERDHRVAVAVDGDLGRRRGVVGERAGERVLHHRDERVGDGIGVEDRVYLAERGDAHPCARSRRALGELHGACVAAGGSGARRHDAEHERHRHCLLQRYRSALGARHRLRQRCDKRHAGHG